MRGGIWHDEHADTLAAARVLVQRGGPNAPVCGARTRTGAACQQPPIREGIGRCLCHAGPHAARLFRERQRQEFFSGKISAEEWKKAEARRVANRLGWEWKKNPWAPGRTIDLGATEGDLRADLNARGLDVDTLAPAVADWLRWRYRRTQIDRTDARGWQEVLTEALPGRIAKAGPCPAGGMPKADEGQGSGARLWVADADCPAGTSKRRQGDLPRAPKIVRGKGYGRRGRPRTQATQGTELDDLMETYRAHHTTVAPMLERCRNEGERLAVLRALRDFMAAPEARGPREQWLRLATALRQT